MKRRPLHLLIRAWDRLASRQFASMALLFVVGLAGCGIIGLRHGPPAPRVHDEFAYLLAGDTFAGGRITNPTHPHHPFFETIHVLHNPSYMGKYPPGQGLQLALGQVLGHPILGVYLTVALMGAAVYWALIACVPGRWALFGGLFAVVKFGIVSYYGHSYWGGSLFALCGALVFGAVVRAASRPAWWQGAVGGAGAGLMAITRPMEGFIFCAVSGVGLLTEWFRHGAAWEWKWKRPAGFLAAGLVAALPALVFLLVFNAAVTGSAWKFPHMLYHEQYLSHIPLLNWQAPADTPLSDDERIRQVIQAQQPSMPKGLLHIVQLAAVKFMLWAGFYLAPLHGGALVVVLWASRRYVRFDTALALALVLVLIPVFLATRPWWPHYNSAWVVPGMLLLVESMRLIRLRKWGSFPSPFTKIMGGKSLGGWRVAMPLLAFWYLMVFVVYVRQGVPQVAGGDAFAKERAAYEQELLERGGRYLVIIEYGPEHNVHYEWVYNRADIDGASIVWAISRGEQEDARLIGHFRGRTVIRKYVNH